MGKNRMANVPLENRPFAEALACLKAETIEIIDAGAALRPDHAAVALRVHVGKAPVRAADVKEAVTLAPKAKAAKKDPVARKGTEREPNLPVVELFRLPAEELARLTKEVYADGGSAVFRFFFKATRTTLVMSVVPVRGQSILLTVVDGEGWLIEDFPVGTAITLEEIRAPFNSVDVRRLNLVANFRGVMNALLMEQLRSLSEKLTVCQRRNRYE